jgi:precorrin-2 dehydrogenase/sirohydrochlorin ferrochelatase
LAQRLRKEINELLPLDTGDWLAELGNLRREVLEREPLNEKRRELLHQLAGRDVCAYDGCPSRAMARAHAVTNPRVSAEDAAAKAAVDDAGREP